MDMNFIYASLFTLGILIFSFIVVKLRQNKIISAEELNDLKNLFNISSSIVKELNISKDEKVSQISEIVLSALDFACNVYGEEDDDKIVEMAVKKSFKTCEQFKVPLTEQRKLLIEQLVKLGLKNVYSKVNGKTVKIKA